MVKCSEELESHRERLKEQHQEELIRQLLSAEEAERKALQVWELI